MKQAREAWHRGEAPEPLLDRAEAAAAAAIAAAPDQGIGQNNLGDALLQRARYALDRGRDPTPVAEAARQAFDDALARLAHPLILLNLAATDLVVAAYELERGRDPRTSVRRARASLDRALAQTPDDSEAHRLLGAAAALQAGWRARRGEPADDEFAQAVRSYERAAELAPARPDLLFVELDHGWLCSAWARHADRAHAAAAIARGLRVAERLLAIRPRWAAARALHGGLLLARAQRAASADEARRDAALAATELRDALADNPNLAHRVHPDLARARRLIPSTEPPRRSPSPAP